MKKPLKLAGCAVIAALCLALIKPVRAFASQEGSYLYHALFVSGPATFYSAASSWTDSHGTAWSGVTITTGSPTTPAATTMNLQGAVTTAARPASPVEGQIIYDATLHKLGFYDGSNWKTASWTTY